jgi:CRP-like cAMP-binding protein
MLSLYPGNQHLGLMLLSAKLNQNEDHLRSTGSYLLPHLTKISCLLQKLEREDVDAYTNTFSLKFFPKGSYLVKPGSVCKSMWFLNDGIARVFKDGDGNESNMCFFFPGEFIDAYYNTCMGGPSEVYIQFIHDSTVYVINPYKLEQLTLKYFVISEIEKLLNECHIHWIEHRLYIIQGFDAKGRYARLIDCYPSLILEIPCVYLASYIKVTPETFCRIKACFNGS